mmetsp:Transcript_21938/g.55320  ORF Transcript_21938/g.55320 Transcript_21938/m.55320 type:complete len:88 (+) Transcript_21938:668-931(+)
MVLGGGGELGGERLLRAVFDLLDADHDEAISVDDLQRRMGLSTEDAEHMLAEALLEAGYGEPPAMGPGMLSSWVLDFRGFLRLIQGR